MTYYLTTFARGLLFGFSPLVFLILVCPVSIPSFTFSWSVAWISSIILLILNKPLWVRYFNHIVLYLGCSYLLNDTDLIDTLLQLGCTLLIWSGYEWVENLSVLYQRNTQRINHSIVLESIIRPHFFFNVLNSVQAQMRPNDPATKSIALASALIRSTFLRKNIFSTYESERDFVDTYLKLEYLRLEDRLKIQWNVDEQVEDDNPSLPAFLLQPIIENAIRHGIEQFGGIIVIHLYKKGSYLHLKITNDAPKMGSSYEGLGIALKDIETRLAIIYESHYRFYIEHIDNNFTVHLELPWKTSMT